jgi:hypothetical protein
MVDYAPPSLIPWTTTGSPRVMLLVPCMVPAVVQKQACLHQLYRAVLLASKACRKCTRGCSCHPTQPTASPYVQSSVPPCCHRQAADPWVSEQVLLSTSPDLKSLFAIKTVWLHSQLNHRREPAQTVAGPASGLGSGQRKASHRQRLVGLVASIMLREPAVSFHWESTSAKKAEGGCTATVHGCCYRHHSAQHDVRYSCTHARHAQTCVRMAHQQMPECASVANAADHLPDSLLP